MNSRQNSKNVSDNIHPELPVSSPYSYSQTKQNRDTERAQQPDGRQTSADCVVAAPYLHVTCVVVSTRYAYSLPCSETGAEQRSRLVSTASFRPYRWAEET